MGNQQYFDGNDVNLVQLNKVLEMADNFNGWHPFMNEFPGTVNEQGNFMNAYDRKDRIPERFNGDAADDGAYPVDKFTQNLLNNYALESHTDKKDKDPQPTGAFFLTKDTGRKVAAEVLCTHFAKCGADGVAYMDSIDEHGISHYDAAWEHYDVNKEGKIDAVGMSAQFMRFLTRPLGWLDI